MSAMAARGVDETPRPADGRPRRSAAARAPARRASAVVTAVEGGRIAAMCAGVVPQQPPTIRAPASSSRGTIEPK